MNSTYRYFTSSAGRQHRLHEVETILDDTPVLKLVEHHSVRWLSLGNCVKTFFRVWHAIITCLENDAESDALADTTKTKAKGILSSVRNKINQCHYIVIALSVTVYESVCVTWLHSLNTSGI